MTSAPTMPLSEGLPLPAAVGSELTKIWTLRSWWIGVAVVLALSAYFAQLEAELAKEQIHTLHGGFIEDFLGQQVPFDRSVRDAILGSPYQSAALFLPLLVAMASGQEYQGRQILLSATAVPRRMRLAVAKMLALVLSGSLVTIAAFAVSDGLLLLLMPSPAHSVVLSASGLFILVKVLFYAVTMTLVAGALTTLFRSTIPALVVVVGMLILTLMGIMKAFLPALHQMLPMAGAKTMLFGYSVDAGSLDAGGGVILLLGWIGASVAAWLLVFRTRDLA